MPSSSLDGKPTPKQSHEDVRLMNLLLIPTLLGTSALFGLGIWLSQCVKSRAQKLFLVCISLVGAVPALLFVIGYTGILGEAKWFYTFRSWPGSELTASGAGLIAGWVQARRKQSQRVRKQMSAGFFPFILFLCVTIPYLKQICLRPDWSNFSDRWSDGVCLQSSESSCGPASVVTLLQLAGKSTNEREIAMESFTSRRGTENWYLVRTLRRHGLDLTPIAGHIISRVLPLV